jgi:hypothetical protein
MSIVSNTESSSHAARFMAWLPQVDEPVTAVDRIRAPAEEPVTTVVLIRAPIRISERIMDAMKGFAEPENTPVDVISTPVVVCRRKLPTIVRSVEADDLLTVDVKTSDVPDVSYMDRLCMGLLMAHTKAMCECLHAFAWKLDHHNLDTIAPPRATQRRLGFVGKKNAANPARKRLTFVRSASHKA